jgi:hypothetical protein
MYFVIDVVKVDPLRVGFPRKNIPGGARSHIFAQSDYIVTHALGDRRCIVCAAVVGD